MNNRILFDFFQTIYRRVPDTDNLIAWGPVFTKVFPAVADVLAGDVLTVSQTQDHFFTPAVFKEARRIKDNAVGACVAWVDYDDYKAAELRPPLLPPTAIVSSGKGVHYYWALNDFHDAQEIEALNQQLAFKHAGIKGEGTWNIDRLLRVPGSTNWKCNQPKKYPDYTEPLPCTVLELHPEHQYDLKQLMRLQSYDPALLQVEDEKSRSERDWNLAITLFSWGLDEDMVRLSLLTHSTKAQEEPTNYVRRTLERAAEKAKELSGKKSGRKDKDDKPEQPIANVEFTPLAKLVGPDDKELGLSVKLTWDDKSVIAAATAENFASRRAVITWLQQYAGNRTFYGSDAKALYLWGWLVEECPDKKQLQVEQAGRYDLNPTKRIFIYDRTSALSVGAQANVFWEPKVKVDAKLVLGDNKDVPDRQDYKTVLDLSLACQPRNVMLPAFGWVMATLFKPVFESFGARVPLLMFYGVRGSGKTSLIQHTLLPLVGAFVKPISADITVFAIAGHASITNAWPVWIGEYRATNRNSDELQQQLRTAYDGGTLDRGTRDMSINQYKFTAPIIVDGESPFSDPANIDRAICLQLLSTNVKTGTEYAEAFNKLRTWEQTARSTMARHLLNWTLTKGKQELYAMYTEATEQLRDDLGHSRVVNNAAVLYTGLSLWKEYLSTHELDVRFDFGKSDILVALSNTHQPGLGTYTQVDDLACEVSHFYGDPGMGTIWDGETGILWFNLTRVVRALHIYTNKQMLRLQLMERGESYIEGPAPKEGGAEYWGINIADAQRLGLDVYRPSNNGTGPDYDFVGAYEDGKN